MSPLTELDALEILVIVDNEVDPISTYSNPAINATGNLVHIAMRSQTEIHDRGHIPTKELRMDSICCGAHGLSLMIVSLQCYISYSAFPFQIHCLTRSFPWTS
jgi:7,8-dihydropterin-6-yl-methyl-4-(beta-D-ribofuranosyl)aminobenzene 5'-phosphate synthase